MGVFRRVFGAKACTKIKFTAADTFKLLFCVMGGVAFLLGVEYIVGSPKAEVVDTIVNNVGAVPSVVCNTASHKLFSYLLVFLEVICCTRLTSNFRISVIQSFKGFLFPFFAGVAYIFSLLF